MRDASDIRGCRRVVGGGACLLALFALSSSGNVSRPVKVSFVRAGEGALSLPAVPVPAGPLPPSPAAARAAPSPPPAAWLESAARAYYARHMPARRAGSPWQPQPGVRSAAQTANYAVDASACPGWSPAVCNAEGACAEPPPGPPPAYAGAMPFVAADGGRVQDVIQRALRLAWGPDPPQIDLYFRAGCLAADEMMRIVPTIELFWPEGVGEVIIALDAGNGASLGHFIPPPLQVSTRQSYRLVYEDQPCMSGTVMNQVSYTSLDTHSRAEFVVTMDSDAAFHSPVTPDLLFDAAGALLLPFSRIFQAGSWDAAVEYFTGAGTFDGHAMMTQPVSFALGTFAAFREWMEESPASGGRGECYYDVAARYAAYHEAHPSLTAPSMKSFCWMCQLLTFLQRTNRTRAAYNLVNTDDASEAGVPYLRFAYHSDFDYSLDAYAARLGREDDNAWVGTAVKEGICRALGTAAAAAVPSCAGVGRDYVDRITFQYARSTWMQGRPGNAARLAEYLAMFEAAINASGSR